MKRAMAALTAAGVLVAVVIDWTLDLLNAAAERRLARFDHPLDDVFNDDVQGTWDLDREDLIAANPAFAMNPEAADRFLAAYREAKAGDHWL